MTRYFRSLIFAVAALLAACTAADPNADLKKDIEAYRSAMLSMQFDSILLYMPPKMLEMIPADQLKKQLSDIYENEAAKMRTSHFDVLQVGPVEQAGSYRCCTIDYNLKFILDIKFPPSDTIGIRTFKLMARQQYGVPNVKEDPNNPATLNIALRKRRIFAFKSPELDRWKFIEDPGGGSSDGHNHNHGEGGEDSFIKQVLPDEVFAYFEKK